MVRFAYQCDRNYLNILCDELHRSHLFITMHQGLQCNVIVGGAVISHEIVETSKEITRSTEFLFRALDSPSYLRASGGAEWGLKK